MAWGAKVLQTKAQKFELKKLKDFEVNKERVSSLEPLLQDVYANRRPKLVEYEVRRNLVRVFNEMAKEIYGNSKDIPVVVEFGSFVMDLFSTTSDLDLSINFSTTSVDFPRQRKIQTLRKFAKKLYAIQSKGHVFGVLPVTTAKVPIVKCVDRGTGVECDISVENRDGILKSQIIHIISSIDERFQKLSFLMKTWAKAHNINSSKDKTLNSLSIILLVAFHLQTRNPPILPPFSAIFKDGTDPAIVMKSVSNFVNYGKRNEESLAELFVTLLIKLSSVENLWPKGLCASTCSGSWTSKTWDSKVTCISVEDFTDKTQNVARAVGQAEVKQIYKCIVISIQHIFSFMDGNSEIKLRDLLFGQDGVPTLIPGGPSNLKGIAALQATTKKTKKSLTGKRKNKTTTPCVEQAPAKRKLTAEGWQKGAQPPAAGGWGGAQPTTAGGWGATQQHSAGGWGATQQPSVGGWTVTHRIIAGGWETNHKPNKGGWEVAQQPNAGGWAETQQPNRGGWAVNQPERRVWGVNQQPDIGGWAVNHGSDREGWAQRPARGDWAVTQQPNMGGWGRAGQHSGRGWGGISDPRWREAPNDAGLWGHKW